MKELVFDTGLVTYSLNGKCEVSFNPTDSEFVERLFNAFDSLDKRQEKYRNEIGKEPDNRKVFEISKAMNAEMREIVDGVFGVSVCEAVFGNMNVYALAGGLPVWCNLLLAIMDEIDTSFAREQKATNARIKKYTEKYHR